MIENPYNWARNYTYHAVRYHQPRNVEHIREIVAGCTKVHALGTRHSFNGIADCDEDLISLQNLDRVVELDAGGGRVTVEGGIRYGQLGAFLHARGFALRNLASLPHISVAGACATGTHGSGDGNGNLATAVVAMEIVGADGEASTISREKNGDEFAGMAIGLGGFGVVTRLTLEIVPTFSIRQFVYEHLPVKQLENHFEEIMSSAYSTSLFTDWQGESISQVWRKRRDQTEAAPAEWFGATLAPADRHPIRSISAQNCTAQMGVPGPWHERLPHFRMEYTPSSGEELQSEFFVGRENGVAALSAMCRLREELRPLLQISEVRTIAADDLWMSPCFERASVAIHFTWKKDWPGVQKLLPVIEERLAPYGVRPHWGKLFTISPEKLRSAYRKLPEFGELMRSRDAGGKFRNEFLDKHVFGSR